MGVKKILKRLELIKPGNTLELERIIAALDNLDDEKGQDKIARAIRDKFPANTWRTYPKRFDVEAFIIEK